MIQKILEKKKWIFILGAVVIVFIAIYLGVSVYFMSHFYFGSKIGDVDVSGKSVAEAELALQKTMDEYALTIKEKDGNTDTILGDAIALEIEWNTSPASYIEKQKGFDWILKIGKTTVYEIDGSFFFDEAKLLEKIAGLSAMDEAKQVLPVDATVSEYDEQKGYTLVPFVQGTAVDGAVFTSKIKECIHSLGENLDMEEQNCYLQPAVTDDNEKLLATIEQLNKCLDTVITYQVGSSTQVLDASVFQPWLYVNENMEVAIEDEALTAYVKSLGATYNTCYSPKKFMTSYGQEVTITNSHYGWKVDNEAEKSAIVAEILAGAPVARDLHYSMSANSRYGNDYGNSYVEINLTAQELHLYVNGTLVLKTECVTGHTGKGWDTPTGIWGVTYKMKNKVLRGADYATPVKYWMPFAGNVGMHDAQRTDFGGIYYTYEGSHGCINLPMSSAKTIYGYVNAGFPVIVYQLEGTESEKGIAMEQAHALADVINHIDTVTLESENMIEACRIEYDGLSDLAKKFVYNYDILLEAEEELAALKAAAEPDKTSSSN